MVSINSHVLRAGMAAGWNYSGRLVGLGWTALLIARIGFSGYGEYAMAVAVAAMINAGADNAFFVRSLRVTEAELVRERCARTLFGGALAAVGVAVYAESYVVGFALLVAAGELLFNTFKSSYMRSGRPDVTMRFDTIRQVSSIAAASIYLFLVHSPSLYVASILYLLPYLVVVGACLPFVPGHRPALPGSFKEIALLSTEALASAVYSQAPLLVVGAVAGTQAAGYYSVAQVSALAIAMVGQHYANTYVEKLRESSGHHSSAPGLRNIAVMASMTGAVMIVIGIGILVWGKADTAGYVCLILSVFVFARSCDYVFTVILFLQHRDWLRVRATVALAVVQLAILFPLVHVLGAYGAALASVGCELALLVTYYIVIYRSSPVATADALGEQNSREVSTQ